MSAARSFSFPFQPSSTQTADEKLVLDVGLGRQLYMEAVCILQGADFDESVMAVYSYRPERELPRARDSRRRERKYLFTE